MKRWTDEERTILREYYRRTEGRPLTLAPVAALLGRAARAVKAMAQELRLTAGARGQGRRDPEIRRRCRLCDGPVYVDEPEGAECPDCRTTCRQIEEAHRFPTRLGRRRGILTGRVVLPENGFEEGVL